MTSNTSNPDGHDCAWCPARRFTSYAALADHIEHDCPVAAAELATRPRDPLDVLRDALVWADDEGWFDDLTAGTRAMLAPARLSPGKPSLGYPACLFGQFGDASVRVTIAEDGATLQVMLARRPTLFHRTRVHLPPQFALPVERSPVLHDSRAMMERYHELRERGNEAEVARHG